MATLIPVHTDFIPQENAEAREHSEDLLGGRGFDTEH